jgi:hypothetical protein
MCVYIYRERAAHIQADRQRRTREREQQQPGIFTSGCLAASFFSFNFFNFKASLKALKEIALGAAPLPSPPSSSSNKLSFKNSPLRSNSDRSLDDLKKNKNKNKKTKKERKKNNYEENELMVGRYIGHTQHALIYVCMVSSLSQTVCYFK